MDYIYAPANAPNGALLNVHRLAGIVIEGDSVLLTINSYANETAAQWVWQDRYPMPLAAFSGTSYPDGVLEWIVSSGGLFPAGLLSPEEVPLAAAQSKAIAAVNYIRDERIYGGMQVGGLGVFQTTADSIRNLAGKAQRAMAAQLENDTTWATGYKLLDDTMVMLDAAAMTQVGKALDAHIEACYIASWQHKAAIEAAATVEEVNAVDVHSGWPV